MSKQHKLSALLSIGWHSPHLHQFVSPIRLVVASVVFDKYDFSNLGNAGQSKQVFRQLKYKGKMKKLLDRDLLQGILKLSSKYQEDYPDKIIPG